MKNAVFWDVTPCGCCKNRLLQILSTLMMEEIHSFDTSLLTRATRRHIPEDDNLQLRLQLLVKSCKAENEHFAFAETYLVIS
jgi:hypothetical protein